MIHFVLDVLVATPLMFTPAATLRLFGYKDISDVSILLARIVAAALFGIGIESLLGRNSSLDAFKPMLNLKIIWSLSAIIGIVWSVSQTNNYNAIWALAAFVVFHLIWVYWRIRIGKIPSA